jgi:hypothetical protein
MTGLESDSCSPNAQRERFLAAFVACGVLATLVLWIGMGWGNNTGHRFGDPLLARVMYFAGESLVGHFSQTAGLVRYHPGGPLYTHLTPGPEWIQAVLAVLGRVLASNVDTEMFHRLATTILSTAAFAWLTVSA